MKCRFKDCRYDTDVDNEAKIAIDTKLNLLDLVPLKVVLLFSIVFILGTEGILIFFQVQNSV